MEQNDVFPWDDIPDSDVLETGDYLLKLKPVVDEKTSTGKRMLSAQGQVEEPADAKGMAWFENFVTGDDSAPLAIVKGSMGTRRFKKMIRAAQIPAATSVAALCAGCNGALVGVSVVKFKEPETNKDGTPNEYAGQERNRTTAFWKVGERTPQIKAQASGGVEMAPPPVTAAPPMEAAGVVPPITTAPPATAPVPPAVTTAPTAPPEQMVPCSICQQPVPLSQLTTHVIACAKARGISEQ